MKLKRKISVSRMPMLQEEQQEIWINSRVVPQLGHNHFQIFTKLSIHQSSCHSAPYSLSYWRLQIKAHNDTYITFTGTPSAYNYCLITSKINCALFLNKNMLIILWLHNAYELVQSTDKASSFRVTLSFSKIERTAQDFYLQNGYFVRWKSET
jgi:hypothetical protein